MKGLRTNDDLDREITEYLTLYGGTGPESVNEGIRELDQFIQELLYTCVFSGELRTRLEVFQMLTKEMLGEGAFIENKYRALQEAFIKEIEKIDSEGTNG